MAEGFRWKFGFFLGTKQAIDHDSPWNRSKRHPPLAGAVITMRGLSKLGLVMLVAFAGLPGTGKSRLAGLLAVRLPGVVLDKDRLRAGLFPPEEIEYSSEQDDFIMDVAYRAAGRLFQRRRDRYVLIDGRTFSRAAQVNALYQWADRIGVPVRMIECVCPAAVAEQRIMQNSTFHPAVNRTVALYTLLKEQAEPLRVPRLVLDTNGGLADCVEQAVAYVHSTR
jgi:predicted kinase